MKVAPVVLATPLGSPPPNGTRSPGHVFQHTTSLGHRSIAVHLAAHRDPRSSKHRTRLAACTNSRHRPATPFGEGTTRIRNRPASRRIRSAFRARQASRPRQLISNLLRLSARHGPDRGLSTSSDVKTTSESRTTLRSAFDSACRYSGTPRRTGIGPADHWPSRPASGKHHTVDDDRGHGPTSRSCATPSLAAAPPCRRASRGRPLTAPRESGPRFKGRRPAVYTSRCTALSVFRSPCSIFLPASSGSGTVTVPK